MKLNTKHYFEVIDTSDSGTFGPSGYSKYLERLAMQHEDLLPEGELAYGLEQVREHAQELMEKGHAYVSIKHVVEVSSIEEMPFNVALGDVQRRLRKDYNLFVSKLPDGPIYFTLIEPDKEQYKEFESLQELHLYCFLNGYYED